MENVKGKWRTLGGKWFNESIIDILEDAILCEKIKGHQLKVCVGSDSQVYRDYVEYATVVVVLRVGKGGFMFIRNEKEINNKGVKERMLHEVSKSVHTAYEICNLIDLYDVDLEVHADINTDPSFKSNTALKDAMGYILGMGYVFKAKPYAFASSSCADKMV